MPGRDGRAERREVSLATFLAKTRPKKQDLLPSASPTFVCRARIPAPSDEPFGFGQTNRRFATLSFLTFIDSG